MTSIYEEMIVGDHIQVLQPTNWTVHSGVLPNGDNASEKESQTGVRTFGVVGGDLSIVTVDTALEFWIRPHSDWGDGQVLIDASTVSGGARQFMVSTDGINGITSDAALRIEAHKGSAIAPELEVDVWHHIVVHMKTYHSGDVSASCDIYSYVDAIAGPFTIGSTTVGRPSGATADCGIHLAAPTTLTPCDLAKLAWYKRTLTEVEVIQHYNIMNPGV